MSFGFGAGDIVTISQLAVRVYSSYKDAPEEYKRLIEDARALQIVVGVAIHYFKGDTLSEGKRQEGQVVLKGCQSVLEEMDSVVEKYNHMSPGKRRWQVLTLRRVRFGNEDLVSLRARLTSTTGLLSSFTRRFVLTITIHFKEHDTNTYPCLQLE